MPLIAGTPNLSTLRIMMRQLLETHHHPYDNVVLRVFWSGRNYLDRLNYRHIITEQWQRIDVQQGVIGTTTSMFRRSQVARTDGPGSDETLFITSS